MLAGSLVDEADRLRRSIRRLKAAQVRQGRLNRYSLSMAIGFQATIGTLTSGRLSDAGADYEYLGGVRRWGGVIGCNVLCD